jgi:hypothetical protein
MFSIMMSAAKFMSNKIDRRFKKIAAKSVATKRRNNK